MGYWPHFSLELLRKFSNCSPHQMANKRKPESKKCRPTGISLPPHILNPARRMAFQRDISLSALVRELLLERLAQ